MNDKKKITELIYNLCYHSLDKKIKLSKLYFLWWHTGRIGQNLRLSEEGKNAFELAQIEFFEYPLPINQKEYLKMVLKLGKLLKCPFYIGFKNQSYKSAYIRIYDSKVAVVISLYGSLQEYLKIKS